MRLFGHFLVNLAAQLVTKASCADTIFIDLCSIGPREMHHIITILFNRSKPEERVRAEACLRVLIDDAAKLGYGEYRTHLAYYGTSCCTSAPWTNFEAA